MLCHVLDDGPPDHRMANDAVGAEDDPCPCAARAPAEPDVLAHRRPAADPAARWHRKPILESSKPFEPLSPDQEVGGLEPAAFAIDGHRSVERARLGEGGRGDGPLDEIGLFETAKPAGQPAGLGLAVGVGERQHGTQRHDGPPVAGRARPARLVRRRRQQASLALRGGDST
jgi:hypothetical protein